MAQNASTTWASRARNSASVRYHALASCFSNGVWIISNMFLVTNVVTATQSKAWLDILWLVVFYTTFTVTGATFAHWFTMKYLESGSRRVGAQI